MNVTACDSVMIYFYDLPFFLKFDVYAEDSGIPQKSKATPVVITVTRDEYAPQFVNAPYNVPAVQENKRVGERVLQVSAKDQDMKVVMFVDL